MIMVLCPHCLSGYDASGAECMHCHGEGSIEYLPADGYDEEIDASDAEDATA